MSTSTRKTKIGGVMATVAAVSTAARLARLAKSAIKRYPGGLTQALAVGGTKLEHRLAGRAKGKSFKKLQEAFATEAAKATSKGTNVRRGNLAHYDPSVNTVVVPSRHKKLHLAKMEPSKMLGNTADINPMAGLHELGHVKKPGKIMGALSRHRGKLDQGGNIVRAILRTRASSRGHATRGERILNAVTGAPRLAEEARADFHAIRAAHRSGGKKAAGAYALRRAPSAATYVGHLMISDDVLRAFGGSKKAAEKLQQMLKKRRG